MEKISKCGGCKFIPVNLILSLTIYCRALESFFGNLKTYGAEFPPEFWDIVCKELIFPIFAVLKSGPQDMTRFNTQEDMSVWISTTMIQALRDTIDLWTFHFEILERFLDGLLDLLRSFICQGKLTIYQSGTLFMKNYRERHVGPDWHFMFTAVAREQCIKVDSRALAEGNHNLRLVIQDDYPISAAG
jgi:hypothetical protein